MLNITETSDDGGVLINNMYRCNAEASIESGDPWCDYVVDGDKINYNSFKYRCETQNPQVCDWSQVIGGVPQETTEYGCNEITSLGDDYWGQYDSDCVDTISAPANTYDAACCYAFSIDQFDIYDDAIFSNNVEYGIRIY